MSSFCQRSAVLCTLVLLLVTKSASAQEWSIEAQAGRMRSSLDPAAAPSENVVAGIRYADPLTQLRISGAIPTEAAAPLWAAIAGSRRLIVRRHGFIAGVDLTAQGFAVHDRVERTRELPGLFGPTIERLPGSSGFALAGQALPLIGFEAKRIQAQMRAGVSRYSSEFGDAASDRTVRVADVQVTYTPTPSIALVPTLRHFNADEASYTYAGVSGITAFGPAMIWGTLGQWSNTASDEVPWAAGVSLRIHQRASLTASASKEVIDPLYLTAPQTAWSIGAAVRVGGKAAPRLPVPAAYVNGYATIRLPLSQATAQPRIAGDFNGWKPQPMQREKSGWVYTVAVAPGVYNYAFVDADNAWFVPEKFPGRKEDGMGGYVAVLVVQP
jgi:hypothetical protein